MCVAEDCYGGLYGVSVVYTPLERREKKWSKEEEGRSEKEKRKGRRQKRETESEKVEKKKEEKKSKRREEKMTYASFANTSLIFARHGFPTTASGFAPCNVDIKSTSR